MMDAAPILMPKLGLTMTEGQLVSWHVGVGDTVREGDLLFVVETDKIATEVNARGQGTMLSIEVPEGETVAVGAVVATWSGTAFGAESDAEEEPAEKPPPAAPATFATQDSTRLVATPLARRLAREAKVDLTTVAGSGRAGRIKAADIAPATPRASATSRRAATGAERAVARLVTMAKQAIPHFYVTAEVDIGPVDALRRDVNERKDARISINDCIVAALARALAEFPELNAIWDEDALILAEAADVGIVVDSPAGPVMPVLRDAAALPLEALAVRSRALIDKARGGRLQIADTEGGTIGISNVGMFGATALAPIIFPGRSAMLGVGAAKPVFRPDAEGRPALHREAGLVLSCDHRIYDGVKGARLLARLRSLLEQPAALFAA